MNSYGEGSSAAKQLLAMNSHRTTRRSFVTLSVARALVELADASIAAALIG
jgi:hypothetical protein